MQRHWGISFLDSFSGEMRLNVIVLLGVLALAPVLSLGFPFQVFLLDVRSISSNPNLVNLPDAYCSPWPSPQQPRCIEWHLSKLSSVPSNCYCLVVLSRGSPRPIVLLMRQFLAPPQSGLADFSIRPKRLCPQPPWKIQRDRVHGKNNLQLKLIFMNLHKEICTLGNILRCRNETFGPLMISFVEFCSGCGALAESYDFRLQNARFFHQFADAPH